MNSIQTRAQLSVSAEFKASALPALQHARWRAFVSNCPDGERLPCGSVSR